MTPDDFITAARVPHSVEPQRLGPWVIERLTGDQSILGELGWLGRWTDYTVLSRHTLGTLMQNRGEVVMEDSVRELRRHLPIWLAGYGRILITGLGLGCVVRGLLANPDVEHIDVVELCPHILRVIGPEFAGNPRVTLHQGDALKFEVSGRRWDFAWHDLWTDESIGQSNLQVVHAALFKRFYRDVGRQGAWQFPRMASDRIPIHLLGARRRKKQIDLTPRIKDQADA